MKKLTILLTLLILISPIALFIGYYKTSWAEDNEVIFFFKKEPTLKIRFVNYFATDSEDRNTLQTLSNEERQLVIDYCKYHLGITIDMKTQEEMDTCKQGYHDSFKKNL